MALAPSSVTPTKNFCDFVCVSLGVSVSLCEGHQATHTRVVQLRQQPTEVAAYGRHLPATGVGASRLRG